MKPFAVLLLLFGIATGVSGCRPATPSDLFGVWKIDQFTVDGMDRSRKAYLQDDPVDWGSAVEFLSDGSFQTNSGQQGEWKLAKSRTRLMLFTDETTDPLRWKVKAGKQHLILETRTRKIILSRTDQLPSLPEPPPPNLLTNLPGTWYFYQWINQQDTLYYPSTEKQAHWLAVDPNGYYQSGEGRHRSFHGRWQLQQDTLTLSELEHSLTQVWQIQLSNDTLYIEPAADTSSWFQALLVRKP